MIYAYAMLTVNNPEALNKYRDLAGAALARHGGAIVGASGALEKLDGAPTIPDVAAILSFPDKASAESWINDPELADIHALRRNAGASDIVLMA